MIRKSLSLIVLLAIMALTAGAADQGKPESKPSGVRTGKYFCVFPFGDRFFDTRPILIKNGNTYESVKGAGKFDFVTATRKVKFSTGPLASDYPNAKYIKSGPVAGGLKKKTGPALVLRPSAAYKKKQGNEAVPMYCYLEQ